MESVKALPALSHQLEPVRLDPANSMLAPKFASQIRLRSMQTLITACLLPLTGCVAPAHSMRDRDSAGRSTVTSRSDGSFVGLTELPLKVEGNRSPVGDDAALRIEAEEPAIDMAPVKVEAYKLSPYVIFGQQRLGNPDFGPLFLVLEDRSGGRGDGIVWTKKDLAYGEIIAVNGIDISLMKRVDARQLIASLPEPFYVTIKTRRDGVHEVACYWTRR